MAWQVLTRLIWRNHSECLWYCARTGLSDVRVTPTLGVGLVLGLVLASLTLLGGNIIYDILYSGGFKLQMDLEYWRGLSTALQCTVLKGSVTKKISLKSGPNGCIDLWNYTYLQKKVRKKNRKSSFKIIFLLFWPLKLCLCDFAGQSLHCSMILRGKVWRLYDFAGQSMKAPWFCGAKSALLYNFAGQSLHCSMILRGKVCIAP